MAPWSITNGWTGTIEYADGMIFWSPAASVAPGATGAVGARHRVTRRLRVIRALQASCRQGPAFCGATCFRRAGIMVVEWGCARRGCRFMGLLGSRCSSAASAASATTSFARDCSSCSCSTPAASILPFSVSTLLSLSTLEGLARKRAASCSSARLSRFDHVALTDPALSAQPRRRSA